MPGPESVLREMFEAAIAAASPMTCLHKHLPSPPKGRTVVIGAGKAAAEMAAAVEAHWSGELSGLVVTRYGHGAPTKFIRVIEASHPVPDEEGTRAAVAMLETLTGLTSDDLVICLLSGGGSALLSLPASGITIEDKKLVNRALLRSGANITEMNCVRKHLSAIKGGRLADAAAPAKVVSLIISDVPGDDISVVASGPTVADVTTREDALAILERYQIDIPVPVREHLESPASETLKPGHASLQNVSNIIVAAPQASLEAAAAVARSRGFEAIILGSAIQGEARECAIVHAGIALQCASFAQPVRPPCVLISGGETTVTVRGNGKGGRNVEFLLSLAQALESHLGIFAVAGDTDGIDGSEENAGAVVRPDTLRRIAEAGMDASQYLDNNDAYSVFAELGDLIITGPTRTNVNDFRAILIDDQARRGQNKSSPK